MQKKKCKILHIEMLLLFLFPFFIISLNCIGDEIQSRWISTPVEVDGKMAEWEGLPKAYFEKENVLVGVCNDDENLYILFRFGNAAWAHAIRISGMTLWFENSGKKKKNIGIKYTGGAPPSEMPRPGMGGSGDFGQKMPDEQGDILKQIPERINDQITIINKEESLEKIISADGSDGVVASATADRKFFTYEFSIPLKKREGAAYATGAESGQVIRIGLEWGDISEEDLQRAREQTGDRMKGESGGIRGRRGGRDEGGMGRMPSGDGGKGDMSGMPGGRRSEGGMGPGGSMSGSRLQVPEKEEIWLKTILASPPKEPQSDAPDPQ